MEPTGMVALLLSDADGLEDAVPKLKLLPPLALLGRGRRGEFKGGYGVDMGLEVVEGTAVEAAGYDYGRWSSSN